MASLANKLFTRVLSESSCSVSLASFSGASSLQADLVKGRGARDSGLLEKKLPS
jgi:hypothetical protein